MTGFIDADTRVLPQCVREKSMSRFIS
jgi:hypothetical protein